MVAHIEICLANAGMPIPGLLLKLNLVAILVLACMVGGCQNAPTARLSSKPVDERAMNPDAPEDPNLWLEDVTGEKPLKWVRQQNDLTQSKLESVPGFTETRARLLSILDSKERIPYVTKYGPYFYNFWQDEKNPRGVWRRATFEEYRHENPEWETVLDIDELGKSENENWVWKGLSLLRPSEDRALIAFSRGGADAVVYREFDLPRKEFVKDGFFISEAKTDVAWRNRDTVYVGTDFGPESLTTSGYPRQVREWKRGRPLDEAQLIFEGKPEDVAVSANVVYDHGRVYEFISRGVTFFTDEVFVRTNDVWTRIDKPADAELSTFGDQMLLRLRSDWTIGGRTFRAGSLLATGFDEYIRGGRKFDILFEPTVRKSLSSIDDTKNYLLLTELDNVRSRPYELRHANGEWVRHSIDVPEFGTVSISAVDSDESDDYLLGMTDFLTPSSLWIGTAGQAGREKLKSLPEFFDSDGLQVQQFEAKSADGTRVPYFQVSRAGLQLNGKQPVLLYGYGGFEISMQPGYNAGVGAAWLEKGGVYALANIRGGGEFGPQWHNAARKENRQRAYDDFIAVAEDLIARKVTSPAHLGIQGGSNGGLLMGVMLTERPDLFGAIVCQVPLLDMRRYHKLLAGASWMDEYGDPDKPEDWAYIKRYSPYQNVFADKEYPRVLFMTSTRDDRVHPGHARKMVAKMKAQGHDVLYYENIEGGHGGAANNKQRAYMQALSYTFLWRELNREQKQSR